MNSSYFLEPELLEIQEVNYLHNHYAKYKIKENLLILNQVINSEQKTPFAFRMQN